MKTFLCLLTSLGAGILALAQSSPSPAPDQNKISAAYDKIEAEYEQWAHFTFTTASVEGGYAIERHVWLSEEDANLAKVKVIKADDHGELRTEFFMHGDELLFVLDRTESTVLEPNAPTNVEEKRLYFADKKLTRVLVKRGKFEAGQATDTAALKNTEVPLAEFDGAADSYKTQHQLASTLITKLKKLDDELSAEPDTAPAQGTEPANQTTTGTFTGLEEGDYTHWAMKNEKGETVSFFILKSDAVIDKVVENPAPYVGRKCRVTWKSSRENIPEAGGKIRIEQILSVEWLDKK